MSGNPGVGRTSPSGGSLPTFYTRIDTIINAQVQPTDIITPDSGDVPGLGITDAGPTMSSTIQAFLTGYRVGAGLPEEVDVDATSIYVYEPDGGTVTVQEYEPFTYVVHEDTKIVTTDTTQSDTAVYLRAGAVRHQFDKRRL